MLSLSVVIPTFNGEKYIEPILNALSAQEYEGEIEILVVDSGSTDSTVDIVREFTDVRLVQIPNDEFGHGRTRNYGASLCRGEIVAFLTHDAIPTDSQWATSITEPFALNPNVMAVLGRQVPRRNCVPLLKYEINSVFASLGPSQGVTLVGGRNGKTYSPSEVDALSFYSDVNSATRKSFLLRNPYRDVNYAEDQFFGKDVISQGFIKAYAGHAAVEHSNDLSLREYAPRIFDETRALKTVGFDVATLTWRTRCQLIVTGALRDSLKILRDSEFSWRRKLYWLALNPLFHAAKWRGYARATTRSENESYSLESRLRRNH